MDIPVVAPVTPNAAENNSPKVPFFKNRKLVGISAVLFLLAILVIGLVLFKQTAGSLYGVKVFEGQYTSGKVLEFGLFGLKEKKIKVEGELSDYAEYGNVKVAIVRNAEDNTQDVFLLGAKNKQLTTNRIGKASASVSSDGKYIAYAQRADHVVGGDFNPQISAWSVVVFDIGSGVATELGQGFAPQFYVGNDGVTRVLFTTRTGVSSVDISTKSVRSLDFIHPGLVDYSAAISRDGKYLAVPNGLTKVFQIFELTESSTEFSVALMNVGPVPFVHGAFKGHSLLGVERAEDGTASLRSVTPDVDEAQSPAEPLPANSHYRIIY